MNSEKFEMFLPCYAKWHYGQALADIARVWRNYLWFFYNFFSIPVLISTFLTPFNLLGEPYRKGGGFDVGKLFETLLVNVLMRFVGAGVRLSTIITGFFVLVVIFIIGAVALAVWVAMPLVIVWFVVAGVRSLFSI